MITQLFEQSVRSPSSGAPSAIAAATRRSISSLASTIASALAMPTVVRVKGRTRTFAESLRRRSSFGVGSEQPSASAIRCWVRALTLTRLPAILRGSSATRKVATRGPWRDSISAHRSGSCRPSWTASTRSWSRALGSVIS